MRVIDRHYEPSPTCWEFHQADEFVRGLMGPIGSGKSVACCADLMKRATEQAPGADGKAHTRWAIIRNTYRELYDTTIRTWFDWFPKEIGNWRSQDMEWTLETPEFVAEFLFRALDRPDDVKKLLSLELTGAWINEAREVPKAVLDMLQGRVGRFPAMKDGVGPTWSGVIMDTNPPDNDHWWYRIFEEEKPSDWAIFKQPSGLSAGAENIKNLPPEYYTRLMAGHDPGWIDVYVHGQYGFITSGRPVFPEYNDGVHSADEFIDVDPGLPLYVGIDFGLTPAAAICQDVNGQWRVIDEVVAEDMGAKNFARELKRHLNLHYPRMDYVLTGDPAGGGRAQTDETTPFQVLNAEGVFATPAITNDFTIRREAVASRMGQLTMNGQPAFMVSPKAAMTRKALGGGYQYKRVQVSGDERYQDKPDKNKYSHIADALQYACLGGGLGDQVIGADTWGDDIEYKDMGYA